MNAALQEIVIANYEQEGSSRGYSLRLNSQVFPYTTIDKLLKPKKPVG